jgi:hypothetical protein
MHAAAVCQLTAIDSPHRTKPALQAPSARERRTGQRQVHELMWSRNQQARLSSGPYGLGTKTPRFTAIARHGGSPRKRPQESVSATSLRIRVEAGVGGGV